MSVRRPATLGGRWLEVVLAVIVVIIFILVICGANWLTDQIGQVIPS